jgi:hypothetical protein
MTHQLMWKRVVQALCVLGTAGILAGCSSSPTSNSSSSTSTSAPGATTSSVPIAGVTTSSGPTTTTIPAHVANNDAARKNVIVKNCASSSGGWSAGGIVNNPSGSATTYTITIFFTSTGATDLGSASTTVPLAAHKSTLWSVKATFPAPSQVLCVLRGVGTS